MGHNNTLTFSILGMVSRTETPPKIPAIFKPLGGESHCILDMSLDLQPHDPLNKKRGHVLCFWTADSCFLKFAHTLSLLRLAVSGKVLWYTAGLECERCQWYALDMPIQWRYMAKSAVFELQCAKGVYVLLSWQGYLEVMRELTWILVWRFLLQIRKVILIFSQFSEFHHPEAKIWTVSHTRI